MSISRYIFPPHTPSSRRKRVHTTHPPRIHDSNLNNQPPHNEHFHSLLLQTEAPRGGPGGQSTELLKRVQVVREEQANLVGIRAV